ncbi:MAG: electron transport complex subunit RsxG [Pseudomonadota bacterium]|jgi:electron transport complex protein RnfG
MKQAIYFALKKNSLSLTLFAMGCALLLGGIYQCTQTPIALQQQRIQQQALDEIIPASEHDNAWHKAFFILDDKNWQALGSPSNRKVFVAERNNTVVGFILPIKTQHGYSGDIELLLGVYLDGHIAAARVVSHKETPGLGDKIDIKRGNWINSFHLKSLSDPSDMGWHVKKDNGIFDQFAGATITPRACVAAIKQGLDVFKTQQAHWQQLYQTQRAGHRVL